MLLHAAHSSDVPQHTTLLMHVQSWKHRWSLKGCTWLHRCKHCQHPTDLGGGVLRGGPCIALHIGALPLAISPLLDALQVMYQG